jgi:hypothetical protein
MSCMIIDSYFNFIFIIDNWNSDSTLYLTVVTGIDKHVQHPCLQNNGNCSHLCLLSREKKV